MLAGRDSVPRQRARDAMTVSLNLGIGQRPSLGGQAGGVAAKRRPFVEIIDQPHRACALQSWTVTIGFSTSPNWRIAP